MIPEGFTLTRVDDQRFEIAIKGTTIRWKTYGTKAEVEKRLEDHADEWRAKYAKMNGAKQGAGSAYRGVASVEARKKRCKAALKSEEKKAKAEKDRAEREAASKLRDTATRHRCRANAAASPRDLERERRRALRRRSLDRRDALDQRHCEAGGGCGDDGTNRESG